MLRHLERFLRGLQVFKRRMVHGAKRFDIVLNPADFVSHALGLPAAGFRFAE